MGHDGQEKVHPAVDAELLFGPVCPVSADRDQNAASGTKRARFSRKSRNMLFVLSVLCIKIERRGHCTDAAVNTSASAIQRRQRHNEFVLIAGSAVLQLGRNSMLY